MSNKWSLGPLQHGWGGPDHTVILNGIVVGVIGPAAGNHRKWQGRITIEHLCHSKINQVFARVRTEIQSNCLKHKTAKGALKALIRKYNQVMKLTRL